jgi:hypothetical protein
MMVGAVTGSEWMRGAANVKQPMVYVQTSMSSSWPHSERGRGSRQEVEQHWAVKVVQTRVDRAGARRP